MIRIAVVVAVLGVLATGASARQPRPAQLFEYTTGEIGMDATTTLKLKNDGRWTRHDGPPGRLATSNGKLGARALKTFKKLLARAKFKLTNETCDAVATHFETFRSGKKRSETSGPCGQSTDPATAKLFVCFAALAAGNSGADECRISR